MRNGLLVAVVCGLLGGLPTTGWAEPGGLPALDAKPWEGYFVAHVHRGFRFGIGCDGKGELTPHTEKGEPTSFMKAFGITFTIEETMPNGRVVARSIDTASLETSDAASTKPDKVSFRGKVTGGAAFEVKVEFDGSRVAIGGRMTAPGEAGNPQRFAVRMSMRDAYKNDKSEGRQFERKVKDDELRFETTDDKRGRVRMFEKVDLAKECGTKGLRSLRFEMAAYPGRRFEISATEGAMLELATSPTAGELIRGMIITWRPPEPAKDPEGKARMVIDVR